MWSALKVLILVAALVPAPVLGANDGATSPNSQALTRTTASPAEAMPPPATLRFYNRDIVTFRVAYFGPQPTDRRPSTL